jgi:hypothetical protein
MAADHGGGADQAAATVELAFMVTDPACPDRPDGRLLQGWRLRTAETLRDGPASPRVAVIDHDPATGALRPGAVLVVPRTPRGRLRYRIADETDPDSAGFRQVSVFSVVLRMIAIFEDDDVLGRPVRWAFDAPQLVIVPEAGEQANAFYQRETASLRFFSFERRDAAGAVRRAHTCLSPDVVAHEATHAILDGIAPDLHDAASPQALALHEAVADLGAVVLAAKTDRLARAVLERTRGDLGRSGAFNGIAQELGSAAGGEPRPLRDLMNRHTLIPGPDHPGDSPHELSKVLSGALYALFAAAFARAQDRVMAGSGQAAADARFSASGRSLALAADILKRVAFRALDYLPPGEIAFADYARAAIAADAMTNPDNPWVRRFLAREFLGRGIVDGAAALKPQPPGLPVRDDLDLDALVADDDAALAFAERNRGALMIPDGVAFEMRPRLDARRLAYRGRRGATVARAVIVKVAWRETRLLAGHYGDFSEVSLVFGTTLAIDRDQRSVLALLSTSAAHPSQAGAATRTNDAMRMAFLARCIADGRIVPGRQGAVVEDGRLRLRGTARMLHARAAPVAPDA